MAVFPLHFFKQWKDWSQILTHQRIMIFDERSDQDMITTELFHRIMQSTWCSLSKKELLVMGRVVIFRAMSGFGYSGFLKFSGTKRVRVSNFLTSGFGYLFSTHKRISGIIYEAFWQYRSICRFSNHKDDHNSATQSVKLSFWYHGDFYQWFLHALLHHPWS